MKLGYVERKYLHRLQNNVFADVDKYISKAYPTLRRLEEKGLVQHVTEDGEPLPQGTDRHPDYFWEITEEGEQALEANTAA
jgi:predicted transcriptional regulator